MSLPQQIMAKVAMAEEPRVDLRGQMENTTQALSQVGFLENRIQKKRHEWRKLIGRCPQEHHLSERRVIGQKQS